MRPENATAKSNTTVYGFNSKKERCCNGEQTDCSRFPGYSARRPSTVAVSATKEAVAMIKVPSGVIMACPVLVFNICPLYAGPGEQRSVSLIAKAGNAHVRRSVPV